MRGFSVITDISPNHLPRSPSCQFQPVVAVCHADLDLSRHHDMHFATRFPLRRDQLTAWVEVLLRGLGDTAQIGRSEFGEKGAPCEGTEPAS
jgi:hypothetical protein